MSGLLSPPADMAWGPTRMRILMKFKDSQNLPPMPCENFPFGQVEDYCVHLGPATIAAEWLQKQQKLVVYPQPAQYQAWIDLPDNLTEGVLLEVLDPMGKTVLRQELEGDERLLALDISNLATGMYMLYLQTKDNGQFYREKLLVLR
jgi:hypothetical protein